MTDEERAKKWIEQSRKLSEVGRLYMNCTDSGVEKYFDTESTRMLNKKIRVLKAINGGKKVPEEDYYSILEKMPKDKNGKPTIDVWW